MTPEETIEQLRRELDEAKVCGVVTGGRVEYGISEVDVCENVCRRTTSRERDSKGRDRRSAPPSGRPTTEEPSNAE